jgi:DNA polymerase
MSLDLDDRQRAMLAEMGIRVWAPRPQNAPESVAARAHSTGAGAEKRTKSAPAQPQPAAPQPAQPRPTPSTAALAPTRVAQPADAAPPAGPALAPRPAGVESMDWPALQATVADCRACGLCASRTQTVFGVGSRTADWMVVGEAPGETEDRQGQPFVGPAGQLLDHMLAAIGLSRGAGAAPETGASSALQASAAGRKGMATQGVYIANVLKCRPPNNRNPQPDEVAQCEPYLRRQVALVQPRIILAMGRFAVQSLLQTTEPIGRLRGRVHQYQGVPDIVTYHPAYLLRALPDKAKAWQDLCLAMQVASGAA